MAIEPFDRARYCEGSKAVEKTSLEFVSRVST